MMRPMPSPFCLQEPNLLLGAACSVWRDGRVAYGGALLRRWAERPAWVRIPLPPLDTSGRVAEWLKAHAWKACGHASVSWVQIPPRPLRRLGGRRTRRVASTARLRACRHGGVAERQCTGLENRRPHGLQGSNPCPSASFARFFGQRFSPVLSLMELVKGVRRLRGSAANPCPSASFVRRTEPDPIAR